MTNSPDTLTEDQAVAKGYRSMTTSYNLPHERWMLDNVIADMRRGNVDCILVQQDGGPEVWRRNVKKGGPLY